MATKRPGSRSMVVAPENTWVLLSARRRQRPELDRTEGAGDEVNTQGEELTALGRYVPPKVVTDHDLAQRVDTNHDWVVSRTGIVERHWVEPGTPTSELAAHAVGDLLKNRGIEAK